MRYAVLALRTENTNQYWWSSLVLAMEHLALDGTIRRARVDGSEEKTFCCQAPSIKVIKPSASVESPVRGAVRSSLPTRPWTYRPGLSSPPASQAAAHSDR